MNNIFVLTFSVSEDFRSPFRGLLADLGVFPDFLRLPCVLAEPSTVGTCRPSINISWGTVWTKFLERFKCLSLK